MSEAFIYVLVDSLKFCVLILIVGLVSFGAYIAAIHYGVIQDPQIEVNKKNITLGKEYLTQCKLIENNIYNGLFSVNTNKIECNGVIDNVNMDDYNTAVSAYKNSLNNEK